jgi:aryl-alcohol dehydrogenase-like predicted oxidoreductase
MEINFDKNENLHEMLEEIKQVVNSKQSLVHTAIQFILSHPEVTTVIPGIKNSNNSKRTYQLVRQRWIRKQFITSKPSGKNN